MDTQSITDKTVEILSPLVGETGPLFPILHAVQAHFGYVPTESVPPIAKALNLSRAEVHGVISFYHSFRPTPGGQQTVYVCRAESCQAMGSKEVEQAIKKHLDIDYHETTANGEFTLEPVYCLGNCACSPAIMVDDKLHSRVRPEAVGTLLGPAK